MSEHTKGELDAIGATIYRKQTYIGGCAGYFEKTALSDDVNEANAKELVRRYNAFEDGGLVEELRTACERFKFIPDCGGDFCIQEDGTWWGETTTQEKCQHIGYCHWAYDNTKRFEAALAKS